MGQKNFGGAVSGYLDPTGRAFEQAVYQAGKPVLDKDLNLSDEVASLFGLELARKACASGWFTDDPLNNSDSIDPIFTSTTTANQLILSNNLRALVNGWIIDVQCTNHASSNRVTFNAPPTGAGAKRTDLLVLEVWRKLLSAAPSTDGKTAGGKIWRNGNVKVPTGLGLNYDDDILDGTVGTETTKRVQIQYRLRAVHGVDVFTYPAGIDDPAVVANTVPPTPTTPDGNLSSFVYVNQSANGDPGLWRAGDGDPSNALGTVDGYMYAIPLVAIFRRNSTAFDRNTNHNGGGNYPSTTRPDGFYADVFQIQDVADLRRAVSLTGWSSYQEIAEKNFGYLLDNNLKTEWTTTPIGGGVNGHSPLWADEIGVLPGDGVVTGDTPGAEFLGQFDCTRRFFSDRPIYEVMTFTISPGDPNVSTSTWQTGTQVTINPSVIAQYPYSGAIGFLSRAPSGTRIVDVTRVWVQGASAGQKSAEVGMLYVTTTTTPWPVESITGIGSYPPGNIVITLGAAPVSGFTTEPMYVDLLIAYPPGCGLAKTPSDDFGNASFSGNNPGALPNTAPVSFASADTLAIDATHREAQMQYLTGNLTYSFISNSTHTARHHLMPERVKTLVGVTVNGNPAPASVDSSGRDLNLVSAAAIGSTISVTYQAVRPYPQTGFQMTVYYRTRAPQTVHSSVLGTSITFVPRWISPSLYTITTGSASQGEGYPYPLAYVQTGGIIKNGGTWSGEHELDGAPEIYVAEFNASTGFLKVPAYIPYVPNPEGVTFTRSPSDIDIEGRTYFPNAAAGYNPNAFGQNLSDDRVHKVVLPTLMESTADTTLGPKGALYLVLLIRWASFDAENSVKFLNSNNTTVAAVFRVAGNLLNRRS